MADTAQTVATEEIDMEERKQKPTLGVAQPELQVVGEEVAASDTHIQTQARPGVAESVTVVAEPGGVAVAAEPGGVAAAAATDLNHHGYYLHHDLYLPP